MTLKVRRSSAHGNDADTNQFADGLLPERGRCRSPDALFATRAVGRAHGVPGQRHRNRGPAGERGLLGQVARSRYPGPWSFGETAGRPRLQRDNLAARVEPGRLIRYALLSPKKPGRGRGSSPSVAALRKLWLYGRPGSVGGVQRDQVSCRLLRREGCRGGSSDTLRCIRPGGGADGLLPMRQGHFFCLLGRGPRIAIPEFYVQFRWTNVGRLARGGSHMSGPWEPSGERLPAGILPCRPLGSGER